MILEFDLKTEFFPLLTLNLGAPLSPLDQIEMDFVAGKFVILESEKNVQLISLEESLFRDQICRTITLNTSQQQMRVSAEGNWVVTAGKGNQIHLTILK